MFERGNKLFACFLDVWKAFDTVWNDGLLYKLFSELGIKGRMWLAVKDLSTDVKPQVLYEGSFHENSVSPREQDKVEILLLSCIKFTLIVLCVSFQTIVFQSLLIGFVSPHPRLLMTSLCLDYVLHFCRRSWIIVLIMVYDGDTNLIIQRVALSLSVKQTLSILFLWINADGS